MEHKKIDLLKHLLTEIERHVPDMDSVNSKVSKATVGWQLDHSLKVINGVCNVLKNSNPDNYTKDVKLSRILLFALGFIPRGQGKSPKYVLPPEVILKDDLLHQITTAKANIEALKLLPARAYFEHFIFGVLSKKQTLRFLEIHTRHHLKIVRDIVRP